MSLLRSWMVIALTPLPCLAHSHAFWLRLFLMTTAIVMTSMVQLRHVVPRFQVSAAHIVWTPSVVAGAAVSWTIALACLVGYPVPFSLIFEPPGLCIAFAGCLYAVWGKLLRDSSEARVEFAVFLALVVKLLLLLYVYAVFNYAFNSLVSYEQIAFALFLPVLKLVVKNWIDRSIVHAEDLRPEVIIFNVEIFHALNVAFSMQNATSRHTIVVLMVLDRVHAFSSEYPGKFVDSTQVEHWIPVAQRASWSSTPTSLDPQRSSFPEAKSDDETKLHSLLNPPPNALGDAPLSDPIRRQSIVRERDIPELSPEEKYFVNSLSQTELREKVEHALQLLHMTELFVLVEYAEAVIPLVYCLYLLVMSSLPNRVYYAQLKELDDDRLRRTIVNVLLYAFLEMLSFLALSWFLGKKLLVSSIRQLAFVLETQWQMVQSKLILWVALTVQSSLEHFGADYSFQFKWLHVANQE